MRRWLGYYARKGMITVAIALAIGVPMGCFEVHAMASNDVWNEKRDEMRDDGILDDMTVSDEDGDEDDAEIVVRLDDGTRMYVPSDLPPYVEVGSWKQKTASDWSFTSIGKISELDLSSAQSEELMKGWVAAYNPYANRGQNRYDWFYFDENGEMVTGWLIDTDDNIYYLNPKSDGRRGAMLTGWQWINLDGDGIMERYYFNEESDGTRGKLLMREVMIAAEEEIGKEKELDFGKRTADGRIAVAQKLKPVKIEVETDIAGLIGEVKEIINEIKKVSISRNIDAS